MGVSISTCGPEEAIVKSGACLSEPLIINGGYATKLPFVQEIQRLDLTVMTLDIVSPLVYTKVGVPITVSSVAQVRISRNPDTLRVAASQFLGMTRNEIERVATQTLEGHQRAIMGTLTVEEIYMDRKKFAVEVREVAAPDVGNLGIEIVSYTIKDVKDDEGYLDALGKKRTAEVKRDARIGQAQADKEAAVKEAEARRQQMAAKYAADIEIADSDKKYQLQKAAFDREVFTEKAKAELSGELQQAKTLQDIRKEEMEIVVVERRKQIEIEEQEIRRMEKELEASVKRPAEAARYKTEQLAEGERIQMIKAAEAEAEQIRKAGEAEAQVVQAKGTAEAERMALKADAWKQYTDGAYLEMIISRLPELTAEIARPLRNTSKIVVVGSSNGSGPGGRLTEEVAGTLAQLPTVVQSLTGVDIQDALKRITAMSNVPSAMSSTTTTR